MVKFEVQASMRIAKQLQSLQLKWNLLEWLWSKLFNRSALCCTSLSALLFLHHCFLTGAWRCSAWSKRIIQACSWSGRRSKTDGAEGTKTRWNSEEAESTMLFLFLLSASSITIWPVKMTALGHWVKVTFAKEVMWQPAYICLANSRKKGKVMNGFNDIFRKCW